MGHAHVRGWASWAHVAFAVAPARACQRAARGPPLHLAAWREVSARSSHVAPPRPVSHSTHHAKIIRNLVSRHTSPARTDPNATERVAAKATEALGSIHKHEILRATHTIGRGVRQARCPWSPRPRSGGEVWSRALALSRGQTSGVEPSIEIWTRRNHSMIVSGRKTMLRGKPSEKPLKNWNEKPIAASV